MKRLLHSLILFLVLAAAIHPIAAVGAEARLQTGDQAGLKARNLLAKMTPEEKVGQLFLVTFKGKQVGEGTPIFDLIVNRHIGGLVLTANNDNFTGPEDTLSGVFQLTTALQQDAWNGLQPTNTDSQTQPTPPPRQYVPLFIGISQEGDGYPYDQILNGVTTLPNEMAIGATWDPNLASQVGSVQGSELVSLGFNLWFGPSLDVLDVSKSESGENLGVRTFGGDPYWVGEMGKAYIAGIHQGSNGKLATIAKYFPGRGGSDRPPDEEVATVRKSLEQLKQIELAPFFAVTGLAPSQAATTDGLLMSHTRYQGFQGNIRATTKPVSFDSAAFDLLMGLPAFASWRKNGGIVVSDSLGSQAVRRLFDPSGNTFDGRQIARNAFLTGNDLLFLDNFTSNGDPDSYTTIANTIDLFTQKYREDLSFAQRVDQSVERLLTLKYRLYPEFALEKVLPNERDLANVGTSQSLNFEVAQRGATLLSPDPGELNTSLPRPPETRDGIVFLTDVMEGRQCSSCASQPVLAVDALQNAVLRLYGPRAGGQVLAYKLISYSFIDLLKLLNNSADVPPIDKDIQAAEWVVVSLYKVQSKRPESMAFNRLLSERPALLRNKKVIVFAFNAPFFLDATDISKVTAYYGMYSKTPAFLDLAARILFQESSATGAVPVSVPGLAYDLITVTSPDPSQVIQLMLDLPAEETKTPESQVQTLTPVVTPIPMFKVGDTLPLRTGVILDHNGKPVPDGTVVRFLLTTGMETDTTQQIETVTQHGVARGSFRIQAPGILEIRVASDPALTSEILRLDVSSGEAVAITAISPTTEPTLTVTPTLTDTPTVTPTVTSTPVPAPYQANTDDWIVSMLAVWGGAGLVLWIIWQRISMRWGIRMGLLVVLGGSAAYLLYLLLDLPAHKTWFNHAGLMGVVLFVLTGGLVGWLAGLIWKQIPAKKGRSSTVRRTNESK